MEECGAKEALSTNKAREKKQKGPIQCEWRKEKDEGRPLSPRREVKWG